MATATVSYQRTTTPRDHWLWGNFYDYTADPLGFLLRCSQQGGDLVELSFSPFRVVLLNHPDLLDEALIGRYKDLFKSPSTRRLGSLIGNGLVLSEGEFWRRERRLSQPAFHRERITAYGKVMVDSANRRADRWRNGETLDLQHEMMRLTLAIIGQTLFSADLEADADEVGSAMATALELLQRRINGPQLMLPDWLPTPDSVRLQGVARRLDRLVFRIIQERRQQGGQASDLLSMLLTVRDSEDGTGMTDRQLRDEMVTLILAGHETTAVALTWTWVLLSQHPEAEQKLLAELRRELGGRPPEPRDLARLPYTSMVISEAMRLYPPIWGIARQTIGNLEIGGHPVKKGAILVMCQWAMHRNARYFPNPESFCPERWEGEAIQRLPRFAYFPFGGGPRQCIGNQFAQMEAGLVLATLAQRFSLRLEPHQDLTPAPMVTLRPKHTIHVRADARG